MPTTTSTAPGIRDLCCEFVANLRILHKSRSYQELIDIGLPIQSAYKVASIFYNHTLAGQIVDEISNNGGPDNYCPDLICVAPLNMPEHQLSAVVEDCIWALLLTKTALTIGNIAFIAEQRYRAGDQITAYLRDAEGEGVTTVYQPDPQQAVTSC